MVEEDGEKNVYQMQKLKNLEQSKKVYSEKYAEYCSKVSACIKNRLGWSDLRPRLAQWPEVAAFAAR